MSSQATKGQTPDMYGQLHPMESPELIAEGLKSFEEQLQKILSANEASCVSQAFSKCPHLMTNKFKLMFLRAEVFNADLAAERFATYWERRVELFGPNRAYADLTLESMKPDIVALTIGFMRPTGVKDPMGRHILFLDPSKQDRCKYERESMARAFFFLVQKVLESDEETQKHGVIMMAYPHNAKLSQLDRPLAKLNIGIMKGAMPMRMSALHFCHPPPYITILLPFIKLLMRERLRKRINIHSGSKEKVLTKLAKFGITADKVPTDLGGMVMVDIQEFLAEVKKRE